MLMSIKNTVFLKALESDVKMLLVMVLFNTVWLEVQEVKAACKAELCF